MGASLFHFLHYCDVKDNPYTSHVCFFQRPGARFGPAGIRAGSQRIRPQSWNPFLDVVASDGQELVDCGDVPMSCVPLPPKPEKEPSRLTTHLYWMAGSPTTPLRSTLSRRRIRP